MSGRGCVPITIIGVSKGGMGYSTIIIVHNDAQGAFENAPKGFGEAILAGMARADMEHRQVSVPFHSYANYINVEPPRHGSDNSVLVFTGNCLSAVGWYSNGFSDIVKSNPDFAKKLVKVAQDIITGATSPIK